MDNEILKKIIRIDVLKEFEKLYLEEKLHNTLRNVTTFNYASCLVQSPHAVDIRKGISLFFQLLEIKEDAAFSLMDCSYFIALGKARIKDYNSALHYTEKILKAKPDNLLVQNLQNMIKKNKKQDELKKVVKSGGSLVTVGGIFGLGLTLARML